MQWLLLTVKAEKDFNSLINGGYGKTNCQPETEVVATETTQKKKVPIVVIFPQSSVVQDEEESETEKGYIEKVTLSHTIKLYFIDNSCNSLLLCVM